MWGKKNDKAALLFFFFLNVQWAFRVLVNAFVNFNYLVKTEKSTFVFISCSKSLVLIRGFIHKHLFLTGVLQYSCCDNLQVFTHPLHTLKKLSPQQLRMKTKIKL